MKNMTWKDWAEFIGILSIVAGLILVALEINQANNIAKAQMVMDLAGQANEFNSSAFANPDVADLLTVISDPEWGDVSETQESMIPQRRATFCQRILGGTKGPRQWRAWR